MNGIIAALVIISSLGLTQCISRQRNTCTVMKASVVCEDVRGDFLTSLKGESIKSITIMRSNLMDVSEQKFSNFTEVSLITIDFSKIPRTVISSILLLKRIKALTIKNSNFTENSLSRLRSSSTLEKWCLKWNNLHNFGDMEQFSHLKEIDLSHNEIEFIDAGTFRGMPALKKMDISYNRLASLGLGVFNNLKHLEEIDLSHNNIPSLVIDTFRGVSALWRLDISYNMLTSVGMGVFDDLPSLEEIDVSHNEITTIEADAFRGLSSLRKVDISNNRLRSVFDHSIQKGVFDDLPSLEEIDLSHNKITTIESDAFRGLCALRRLDLSHNALSGDFDTASLSLPAGCVFQGLVASCPGQPMGCDPPGEDEQLAYFC